jgi:hypothetical protein
MWLDAVVERKVDGCGLNKAELESGPVLKTGFARKEIVATSFERWCCGRSILKFGGDREIEVARESVVGRGIDREIA